MSAPMATRTVLLVVAALLGLLPVVVASAPLDAAPPAPTPLEVPTPRIVGGSETANGEYPFQVALLDRRVTTSSFAAQFCGGTLVAPTVVLTAAHCLVAPQASAGIDVLVGGHDLTTTQGTRLAVVGSAIHPRFDQVDVDYDHDFAVLQLEAPAGVEPVRLVGVGEDAAWAPQTPATTIGWGRTFEGGPRSPVLREVTVPVITDAACATAYGTDLVAASMVCAGVPNGGLDSCNGDSGGPLLVPDPDEPAGWLQVGITSWGIGCARPGEPGVYAEVAKGRPWIDQFLPPSGRFVPMAPQRLLDTRASGSPLAAGVTRTLDVTGVKGLPTEDISSVVLNVTATGATAPTHLTVWPTGETKPGASTLNLVPGQTMANLTVARVGATGTVSIVGKAGTTHVVVDVVGWFTDGRGAAGARFTALPPTRLFDTRAGLGVPEAPLGPTGTVDVEVAGHAGIPSDGATAVVLNLTGTQASDPTNLTAWAADRPRPATSNLNLGMGPPVANLVVAELSADGRIRLFNRAGTVEVLGDVVGWFGPADGSGAGGAFTGLTPSRILDTRTSIGGAEGPVAAGASASFAVAGVGGVPAGADAVVLNVTAVGPTALTHLTVLPDGTTPPRASNLNATAGQTVANLVVVPVGVDGRVRVRNESGEVYVVADVVGFFDT